VSKVRLEEQLERGAPFPSLRDFRHVQAKRRFSGDAEDIEDDEQEAIPPPLNAADFTGSSRVMVGFYFRTYGGGPKDRNKDGKAKAFGYKFELATLGLLSKPRFNLMAGLEGSPRKKKKFVNAERNGQGSQKA
jgi:hypothetical protein